MSTVDGGEKTYLICGSGPIGRPLTSSAVFGWASIGVHVTKDVAPSISRYAHLLRSRRCSTYPVVAHFPLAVFALQD
jgi:hypothetical protein